MNSSRPSSSDGDPRATALSGAAGAFGKMDLRGTGRWRVLPAAVLLALAVLLPSCKNEIEAPTLGTVEIQLRSARAGSAVDAQLFLGDSLLVPSTSEGTYTYHLPAGVHRLRLTKDCMTVLPASGVEVEVRPGQTSTVLWTVRPNSGLEVVSNIRGAAILLDGVDTGRRTPDTVPCVPQGTHTVTVRLMGATSGPDSVHTVVLGDSTTTLSCPMEPLSQQKGVLTEVFTATLCPNCPVADAAAESLWSRPEVTRRGYVGLQVHTRWGGTDPFYNEAGTKGRIDYFDASQGLPKTRFNASREVVGAGSGSIPALIEAYQAHIQAIQDGADGATPVALYWIGTGRQPGAQATGTVRVMMVEDVDAAAETEIWALTYKDRLTTSVPGHGNETFYKVVREYKRLGSLAELGLAHRGDWTDLAITFDLSWDTRWPEDRMGLVVFVQDTPGKKVHQMLAAELP